jgi:hypothetical protein
VPEARVVGRHQADAVAEGVDEPPELVRRRWGAVEQEQRRGVGRAGQAGEHVDAVDVDRPVGHGHEGVGHGVLR